MARPTKLNADLQKRICDLLRAGNFVDTAVRSCGISPSTHFDWMVRGEIEALPAGVAKLTKRQLVALAAERELELPTKGTGRGGAVGKKDVLALLVSADAYRGYRDAILEALAFAESHAVTLIQMAAASEWRAAAFYLERAHPERWGRRSVRDTEWDPAPPVGGPGAGAGAAPNARKMTGPDGEPL